MARRRPVYITPGRHPFEVGVLLACVLVGTVMTFGAIRPPSMARGLPEPLLTAWLLLIALGGLVGLVGAFWRADICDALLIEVAGVCAVAAAMTLYSIVLLVANPWPTSIGSAGLLAGIAVGATGRTVQCVTEYRRLRAGRVERYRVDLPLLVEGDDPEPDPGTAAVTLALYALVAAHTLADPSTPTSPPAAGPSLPGLPGLTPPPGSPTWLVVVGYLLALLGTLGIGGVLVKLLDRRKDRASAERTEVEADEVFTRVAVTLVEPLRDRLEQTERRLTADAHRHADERADFERELQALRVRVREALTEADGAATEAHRLRRMVQQWHRAIMDPAATLEWLRTLVGPDEPAI